MVEWKIGIVTFPLVKASEIPLYNLVSIINSLTKHVYVITGNSGSNVAHKVNGPHFDLVQYTIGSNIITRIYNYAKVQLKIAFIMFKLSKNVDFWIFPIGGHALLPSMILAKIQRKPILMALASSSELMLKHHKDPLAPIVMLFVKINYFLATKIILYSSTLISDWGLEPHRHKIVIAHRHFIDYATFTVTTPYSDRPPLIGYIGRLSEEKGIQHFCQALGIILRDKPDYRAFICGDGILKESIKISLQDTGVSTRVNLLGWIPHDDLPRYLNQLRLLIIPSYTEGLPNIMLEAMACGTPVLATPVGAIKDIIIDGKTGFIMDNNSQECIADNVLRALSSQEIEAIARNGRQYVAEEFFYENVVENWKRLLSNIG